MKITKSQLKEMIRNELNNSVNENVDMDSFHKATLNVGKVHSGISMKPNDILDAVLAGLILDKGLNGAKKWVKEFTDTYKKVYSEHKLGEEMKPLTEWSADEVLKQLGGNKFIAMTGAKNLGQNNTTKTFHFQIPMVKNGITHVKITLKGSDTYTMQFMSVKGTNIKIITTVDDIRSDQLQSVFTKHTGLKTSL